MRATLAPALSALAVLVSGCGQRQTLFSKTAPPRGVPLRDASGAPSYVGRWATSAAMCGGRAWTLTASHLVGPDGLSCAFVKLETGSAGYSGDVVCGADAAPKAGRMTLTFSGQGRSRGLTLEGDVLRTPVGLVACPAAPAPAPLG